MLSLKPFYLIFSWAYLTAAIGDPAPAAVYDGDVDKNANITLRIGNGGAGQSGLVKALADAFIKDSVDNHSADPFRIAWYTSDTTVTINYLKTDIVDVGITYHAAAERIAVESDIATCPIYYAFRDHFLITGPPCDPANIASTKDILPTLTNIRNTAEGNQTDKCVPTRFLSRYDKSATNIKESELWIAIGQVPWATAYSTWYHQYIGFPIQALTAAILLQEYTLTDWGTFLSLPSNLTSQTKIFKRAGNEANDTLLNPARLLVGKNVKNRETGIKFAEWLVSSAGQGVISGFKKNGEQLYEPAPSEKEPECAKGKMVDQVPRIEIDL